MKSLIKIEGASKEYKGSSQHVLTDINLEIQEGEMLAIVGTSGAGKSTLLNCIGLCMEFTQGHYYFQGKEIASMKEKDYAGIRNRMFGYVTQDFSLIPGMSVYENVVLPLYYSKKRVSGEKKEALCKEKLQLLGIEDKLYKKVEELSGGQKQRVAIARAMIADQSIIMADEPTGALDSKTSMEIMDVLTDLNQKGKTIILVTHDLEIAKRCKRMIEIKDGKIREVEVS